MMDDPISATDLLRDVPKDRWPDLMRARRDFAEKTVAVDCRCLLQFCNDCDEMFEVLGFPDPESMIREGLGFDEQLGRLIAAWLDLSPQVQPRPCRSKRRGSWR